MNTMPCVLEHFISLISNILLQYISGVLTFQSHIQGQDFKGETTEDHSSTWREVSFILFIYFFNES